MAGNRSVPRGPVMGVENEGDTVGDQRRLIEMNLVSACVGHEMGGLRALVRELALEGQPQTFEGVTLRCCRPGPPTTGNDDQRHRGDRWRETHPPGTVAPTEHLVGEGPPRTPVIGLVIRHSSRRSIEPGMR